MSKVADLIAAIDAEGSSSWAIADHIASLDEPLTLKEVSEVIWDQLGVEWSPQMLSAYRQTATAFPPKARALHVSFRAHQELRAHPDKLVKWTAKHPGEVLTVERAKALRGGGASMAKKDPNAWKADLGKAFRFVERAAETDPAYVVEWLEGTAEVIRKRYPKKIGARRDLRAV